MLSERLISTFDQLLTVEREKITEQVQGAIAQRIGDASARGILNSSMACQMVALEGAKSLPVFGQLSFNLLLRCIGDYGVEFSDEVGDEAYTLLSHRMQRQLDGMTALVLSSAPFRGSATGMISKVIADDLRGKAELELIRVRGELDLVAARAANRREAAMSNKANNNMVFNGPVGVVQTGAGSTATAHQHIDQGAKDTLIRAIDALLEALTNAVPGENIEVDEVREMLLESRDEAVKEKPNGTKLKAMLAGAGTALSYVPRLREGYDNLKSALGLVGVDLP